MYKKDYTKYYTIVVKHILQYYTTVVQKNILTSIPVIQPDAGGLHPLRSKNLFENFSLRGINGLSGDSVNAQTFDKFKTFWQPSRLYNHTTITVIQPDARSSKKSTPQIK